MREEAGRNKRRTGKTEGAGKEGGGRGRVEEGRKMESVRERGGTDTTRRKFRTTERRSGDEEGDEEESRESVRRKIIYGV